MYLNLTENQKKQLSKGKTIQVRPEQMDDGDLDISAHLEPKDYKKLVRAYNSGRGTRINGGNLLGQIYLGARKMGLSKGDVKAVGRYLQPISRAFLKNSQSGLTDIATKVPQMATAKAMSGLNGKSAPSDVVGSGFRGKGIRGGEVSGNPYMPTALKGGSLISTIKRKTKMSKGDIGAIGRWAQPITRPFLKNSQSGLAQIATKVPQLATEKAMSKLNGAGIRGGRVYTDGKDILRVDQQAFQAPIPINPEFNRSYGVGYR
jgi:hypothetical protein